MPLLTDALKLLGLHHTAAHLDDVVALATKRRWSPTQLLEHLVDREHQERARRSLERRLFRSRLGRFTPMDAFDWAWPTRLDRPAVEAALRLDFLTASRNLVLVAAQGLGKTMIAHSPGPGPSTPASPSIRRWRAFSAATSRPSPPWAGSRGPGVTVLGAHFGAYLAEVYRAGIESVPRGQFEAALALNMSKGLAMRRIILPQAIRTIIPAMGNYFVAMFKNSVLVSAIAIEELMFLTKYWASLPSGYSRSTPGRFCSIS